MDTETEATRLVAIHKEGYGLGVADTEAKYADLLAAAEYAVQFNEPFISPVIRKRLLTAISKAKEGR